MSSEHEELTPETEVTPEQADTPMERFRALRRKARASDELTLEIPGYEGELAVTYKSVPREELRHLHKDKNKDDIDLLLELCKHISAVGESGEWEPLVDTDERPLEFDQRLADYLEIPITGTRKTRECLEGAFNLDIYPLAAARHVKALIAWMEGAEVEADERLVGG